MDKMNLNEFVDIGFLQEANRQFFHPLGLVLACTEDDTGDVISLFVRKMPEEEKARMAFGSTDSRVFKDKAANIAKVLTDISVDRIVELGYIVQPIGDNLDEYAKRINRLKKAAKIVNLGDKMDIKQKGIAIESIGNGTVVETIRLSRNSAYFIVYLMILDDKKYCVFDKMSHCILYNQGDREVRQGNKHIRLMAIRFGTKESAINNWILENTDWGERAEEVQKEVDKIISAEIRMPSSKEWMAKIEAERSAYDKKVELYHSEESVYRDIMPEVDRLLLKLARIKTNDGGPPDNKDAEDILGLIKFRMYIMYGGY